MSIQRLNRGNSHSYRLDGQPTPGVTSILDATLAKPALIEWAGNTTAGYAVDFWAELAEMPPSKRLDRLKRSRYEERDRAARRGTEVHRLAERIVVGEGISYDDIPEEIRGHVESYVDFLNLTGAKPVLIEAVIAHRHVGYCGTLDLVADLDDRWLLDVKTTRSGIYPEHALQLCAYARAEVYADGDQEIPMADLGIDRVGALWVRADGWDLHETRWDDSVWHFFRSLAWIYRQLDGQRLPADWVGPALARAESNT